MEQPKAAHRRQHTGGCGTYGTDLAHWDSQKVLIDASIQVQHLVGLPFSLLPCGKGVVPFLPKELPTADEGGGVFEFPSNHSVPLVQPEG